MQAAEYRFVTHWRVPGTCERVYAILDDVPRTVRFWPQLYRSACIIAAGDGNRGKTVQVQTKGFLPYIIHWTFRVTECRPPYGFSIEAWGDLVGTGRWILQPEGSDVNVTYEWTVRSEKPLLKYLSFLLRPLFALNHNWVMDRGLEGLRRELALEVPSTQNPCRGAEV